MHGIYVNIINRQLVIILPKKLISRKYFVHKQYVPKASTDVKISTFFDEKWDKAVDHKMDL